MSDTPDESEVLFDPESDDLQDDVVTEDVEVDNDGPVEHEGGQEDGS
jgi:hypothetical protein